MGIEQGKFVPESELRQSPTIKSVLEEQRDYYFAKNKSEGIRIGKLLMALDESHEFEHINTRELSERHISHLKKSIENFIFKNKSIEQELVDIIDLINFIDQSNELTSKRSNN